MQFTGWFMSISRNVEALSWSQLDPVYVDENLDLLDKGCTNMQHHIRNAVSVLH